MTSCPTGCGRTTTGEMCNVCWSLLRGDLESIDELVLELTTAAAKQARFGAGGIGVITRASEQPLVVDLAAAQVHADLRELLASWVLDVHETNANWPLHCGTKPTDLAAWLLLHPNWIARHPAAYELYDELTHEINHAWLSIDRPPDRQYLGICSATINTDPTDGTTRCGQDLYATPGRIEVTCPRCTAVHVVRWRRDKLVDAVADQLLTAADMSRALPGLLNRPLTAAQIRGWAHRGKLAPHPPHPRDPRQLPRYRVGDVRTILDTLATEAACA